MCPAPGQLMRRPSEPPTRQPVQVLHLVWELCVARRSARCAEAAAAALFIAYTCTAYRGGIKDGSSSSSDGGQGSHASSAHAGSSRGGRTGPGSGRPATSTTTTTTTTTTTSNINSASSSSRGGRTVAGSGGHAATTTATTATTRSSTTPATSITTAIQELGGHLVRGGHALKLMPVVLKWAAPQGTLNWMLSKLATMSSIELLGVLIERHSLADSCNPNDFVAMLMAVRQILVVQVQHVSGFECESPAAPSPLLRSLFLKLSVLDTQPNTSRHSLTHSLNHSLTCKSVF